MDNNSLWKKVIDIITILILGSGVIVGYQALQAYRNQNNAQMVNSLLGSDTEFYKMMMDKPNLQGIFAIPPRNQNVKETATKLLKIIINDKDDKICSDWNDIPNLCENLFKLEDYNNENKQKLREAEFLCELTLFDILTAFEAKNYDLITEDDYNTYGAYVKEIGGNPLFLCAVYLSHREGYITRRFAKDIRRRLLADPERKRTIEVIYPDLLKDDWVERVGEAK